MGVTAGTYYLPPAPNPRPDARAMYPSSPVSPIPDGPSPEQSLSVVAEMSEARPAKAPSGRPVFGTRPGQRTR